MDPRGEDRSTWEAFRYHSRTFSLATRLLPTHLRGPVSVLYQFCRSVDNLADVRSLQIGTEATMAELERVEAALEAALVGNPGPDFLWQRMAQIHARYHLDRNALYQLLDGARWDLRGCPIRDQADLLHYADLVGGSVGAMMLPFLLQDPDDRPTLEPAARALGVAMQLTNILRDVGEDRQRLDRVYLPGDRLEYYGIDPQGWQPSTRFAPYPALLEELMLLAERYFEEGLNGIRHLAPAVRFGIRSAARCYREILNEVRANRYDNITRRAVVPFWRKLWRIAFNGYATRRSFLALRLLE